MSWSDYLDQTPDESRACLKAVNDIIDEANKKNKSHAGFDDLVNFYRTGGRG